MSDNSLKISFDYKKEDGAVLIIYKTFGGSMYYGSEPTISIIRIFVGKKAIALYSELSGKTIEEIEKGVLGGEKG